MGDTVEEVVKECDQRAVDMGCLTAIMAVAADQPGPAIETEGFVSVARGLAGTRLDGAGDHAPLDDVAECFGIIAHTCLHSQA
jgi:hypothetical protein